MEIDLKVIDKGLKGKGHKTAVIKFAGECGSKLTLILDSRSDLMHFGLEEIYTVKIVQEQQKLSID